MVQRVLFKLFILVFLDVVKERLGYMNGVHIVVAIVSFRSFVVSVGGSVTNKIRTRCSGSSAFEDLFPEIRCSSLLET